MKALLIASLSLFSALASAGYDCRGGDSPQNGKFCHYTVPLCARVSCEEAALCAVKQYANAITGKKVTDLKVTNAVVNAGGEMMVDVSTKQGMQMVTLVNATDYQGTAVCEPVALK